MVEWLLLNRVDLKSGGRSVTEAIQFAVLIGPNVAETGLPVADVAMAGTQVTVDAVVASGSHQRAS